MAAKRSRLSRSSDFQRIYRQGSSTASRFLVLYWFKRPAEPGDEGPRLGLSVSKKLGGAVVRNRIKRLLRERPAIVGLAAPGMPAGSPGMDMPNSPAYDVIAFDKNGKTRVYATHTPR